MRVRIILLISLVLNVALIAAFLGWYTPAPKPAARFVRPVNAATVNSNNVRILKTNVLVRPRWFYWDEVESRDYPTYIENLRGIGMPENTIRDIIIADVDQLYARKRRDLTGQQDLEWWRSRPSAAAQSNALSRAFALEDERTNLLSKLLGENWKADRLDQQPDPVPLTGPILGALPDEVKKTVQDITTKSGERIRELMAQAQEAGQPLSEAEMAKLREQTREQLAQVLNPQQLEEFLLRNSYNATKLRRDLDGLEVTPEEFRSIFHSLDSLDRDLQLRFSGNDPESQRQRAALEQQRQAVIREALGADRYDTFSMLHDPAYQEALAAAQNAGASSDAAAALYEIGRATAEEVARIRNDPNLVAAQKQEQIRQVQAEQQQARSLVLGEPPPATAAEQGPPPLRAHVKVPGETMGEISMRYGIGLSALRAANPGVDINRVQPGAVINIPTGPDAAPRPPLPYPPVLR